MKNRSRFDYVLVETTGMANPGPIASIFWLDEELESDLFLDAIITVVDAKHVGLHLANESGTSEEAAMQIAFADRILLNKIDLVTDNELSEVKDRVRSINPLAPIYCTQNSEVNLDDILGIKAFDATRAMALDSALPTAPQPGPFTSTSTTSPSSRHKAEVGTVAITEERALDLTKFNAWLGAILWESEFADRIFRIKGLLSIKGEDRMVVLQGVHTLFEAEPSAPWPPDRPRQSKVVLIGRRLDRDVLAQGLARCIAD